MIQSLMLTGSSGWLGRFLAPQLVEASYRVVGLDIAPGTHTTVVGSVADRTLIDRIFSDYSIDAVIHSAALHKPDIVRYPKPAFVDVNITGTLNLLEAAVSAGHDRFIFTSTTSLMISAEVRAGIEGGATAAFWLDEDFGPLQPRNIYGVTKLAAENICHLFAANHGLDIAVLRTGRFFPEEDDTLTSPSGPNLKANEFLNRRLAVVDAAAAHVVALENISGRGYRTYILSAPTPFCRDDVQTLITDASSVIARYFPRVSELYAQQNWILPAHIDRVYDASRIGRELGFRPTVDFGRILEAMAAGVPLPYHHDPQYTSPKEG